MMRLANHTSLKYLTLRIMFRIIRNNLADGRFIGAKRILVMEKVLAEQNPHWDGISYDHVIERTVLKEFLRLLKLEEIFVLLGIRRCGKTTMFRSIINHLIKSNDPKSILYINLDAPYFDAATNDATFIYKIVEAAEKVTGEKVQYLFLDEVQNINKWEKFVKSSYDSQVYRKIFVTGSNSKLLQTDYTTLLSGRYVDQSMMTLSFKELLLHKNINDNLALVKEKATVLSMVDDMLKHGCFPKVFLENDETLKHHLLTRYYQTILLKDCLAAGKIRDARLLKELSHYLLTNIATRYAYTNLTEYVDSNEHTVKDYIQILKDGFLIEEIQQFSFSLKKQVRGKKKAYCLDNGLVNAVAFNFFPNDGQLFENLVYTELRKNGATEVFLHNDVKECDFIVKIQNEFIPIQASYALTMDNRSREIDGLNLGMTVSKAKKGIIITYDQEEIIGDNIIVMPFWKLFSSIQHINDLTDIG